MEAASLKKAQEEWDERYGRTQSQKNIAGLNAAKEQELNNSTPDKHEEIEKRYTDLINQEQFNQQQKEGQQLQASSILQPSREFDESLSRTPTEEEELSEYEWVEEGVIPGDRISVINALNPIGMARS